MIQERRFTLATAVLFAFLALFSFAPRGDASSDQAQTGTEKKAPEKASAKAPAAQKKAEGMTAIQGMESLGKNAKGFEEFKNPKDGSVMVLLPEGSFQMGGDGQGAEPDEKPVHKVTISSFLIGKNEVTVAQYKKFCTETGRNFPEQPAWNKSEHPVIDVSWSDATAYCEWAGGRLPTEAEWEYAARGGLEGKRFPWGDEFDCHSCNGLDDGHCDGYEFTSPVGKFPPNGYGLYDMAGNAWEWCQDWYENDSYARYATPKDPKGPPSGGMRVLRGGAWNCDARTLTVAYRSRFIPTVHNGSLGFRCARSK